MYVPSHFEEKRTEVLHDLISRNPFGILVTHCADGLEANHLPFGLDREVGSFGVLYAHVARANPVWQNVTNGDDVLVVFQAGDAYVSPNWYPSKKEFHRQVPTWNYMVAHAHGRIAVQPIGWRQFQTVLGTNIHAPAAEDALLRRAGFRLRQSQTPETA